MSTPIQTCAVRVLGELDQHAGRVARYEQELAELRQLYGHRLAAVDSRPIPNGVRAAVAQLLEAHRHGLRCSQQPEHRQQHTDAIAAWQTFARRLNTATFEELRKLCKTAEDLSFAADRRRVPRGGGDA